MQHTIHTPIIAKILLTILESTLDALVLQMPRFYVFLQRWARFGFVLTFFTIVPFDVISIHVPRIHVSL